MARRRACASEVPKLFLETVVDEVMESPKFWPPHVRPWIHQIVVDRHSNRHMGVVVPSFDISGKGLEGIDVSCADRGVNGIGLTESAELRLRVWMNLMEPPQAGIRPSFYEPLDQFPMKQEEPEFSDTLVMLGVPLRVDGSEFPDKHPPISGAVGDEFVELGDKISSHLYLLPAQTPENYIEIDDLPPVVASVATSSIK
jgi:hypothetical protein